MAEFENSESQPIKYILVSGGVISGVGKGVITSSIGTLLKSYGLRVTAIKIDPYLNIDAGTFSPYEHGESFIYKLTVHRLVLNHIRNTCPRVFRNLIVIVFMSHVKSFLTRCL